jgi:hypothetical protein
MRQCKVVLRTHVITYKLSRHAAMKHSDMLAFHTPDTYGLIKIAAVWFDCLAETHVEVVRYMWY